MTFYDVETSNATFELSVMDKDIPLGSSAIHDIKALCQPDFLKDGNTKSISSLDIAIVPSNEPIAFTTVEPVVQNSDTSSENIDNASFDLVTEDDETVNKIEESSIVTESGDKVEFNNEKSDKICHDGTEAIKEVSEKETSTERANCPTLQIPTCVVTLKVEYSASVKDMKEKLYDLLNEASKRKSRAIDDLRKSAATLSRVKNENNSDSKDSGSTTIVKSGFLEKKSKVAMRKETTLLARFYQKYLGTSSVIQKVFPIAKNYLLFFRGVAVMHFYGQNLALPPPV